MPSIVYGGLKYIQIRHAIYCKKCKETVISKERHDFVMCSCNSVGVDGGITEGNRILGDLINMETRSLYVSKVGTKTLWLPQSILEYNFSSMIKKLTTIF